jgi:hypothetical protein
MDSRRTGLLRQSQTILGIAWKLGRMNALPGQIVAKQLALRAIDPYEGIPPTDSHVAVSVLARTFAIPRKALKDGLQRTDSLQRMHDRLRYCPLCMKLAYHGVMHQRAGATRCPCHGVGAAAPPQTTSSTPGFLGRHSGVQAADDPTRGGTRGLRRNPHRQICAARSLGRASAPDRAGAVDATNVSKPNGQW